MSNKVSCEIIKDMLPLYYDDVCSDESKRMVEEHLVGCPNCKNELDRLKADFILPKEEIETIRSDSNVIKNISSFWNQSKIKSFMKGMIISALLFSVINLGYFGLFNWQIISVSTDEVEIKNVSQLADSKIVYYAETNDGYSLNRLNYDMDKEGSFYITPLRPIIKREAQLHNGFENRYYSIDIKYQEKARGKVIKRIYYGTPKDKILIWEKGMDLPKASEEIENMFHE
ncbi:zf-HC2 domain-containing protein [Lysinibacillus sp. FSL K6-0057]|uniref:zf-HC2 domain-containing protein n=1 Tax=Lysinibacillus sp. FSL K6-0057 TaxID=2921411 RepID=UPI00315AEA76